MKYSPSPKVIPSYSEGISCVIYTAVNGIANVISKDLAVFRARSANTCSYT